MERFFPKWGSQSRGGRPQNFQVCCGGISPRVSLVGPARACCGCRGCVGRCRWRVSGKSVAGQRIPFHAICGLCRCNLKLYILYNTFCINAKTNNDCPTAVRAMKFVTFGSVNVAFAINMLHFLIKFCQVWPEI